MNTLRYPTMPQLNAPSKQMLERVDGEHETSGEILNGVYRAL